VQLQKISFGKEGGDKKERERRRSMWLSRILLLYIYEAVTPFGVYYLLIKLLAHRE
jgi:hypothetical protein